MALSLELASRARAEKSTKAVPIRVSVGFSYWKPSNWACMTSNSSRRVPFMMWSRFSLLSGMCILWFLLYQQG